MTRRSLLRHALLILFGFAAALVVAELCLQLAASYLEATGRRSDVTWLTGNLRVVAMGDSNTYGLLVEREEAYPQVVERLWNEQADLPPIEVMNLGWPGTSSSEIRRHYEKWLAMFQPDCVTVMVGVNDSWSSPLSDAGASESSTKETWWRHTRIHRLLLLVLGSVDESIQSEPLDFGEDIPRTSRGRRAIGGGQIQFGSESMEIGWRAEGGVAGWRDILERNLASFGELAAAADAEFVLITYPSGKNLYRPANKVLRKVAAAHGFPLIELEPVFRERCPGWVCQELRADQHATPLGYELAGEHIVTALRQLLHREGQLGAE